MESSDFNTQFWNRKPGDYSGCTKLMKKMKLGGFVNSQFISVLNHLGTCFETFSENLMKVGRINPMDCEAGHLNQTGQILQNFINNLSEEYKEAGKEFKKSAEKTSSASKHINGERKNIKHNLRTSGTKIDECLRNVHVQEHSKNQNMCKRKNSSVEPIEKYNQAVTNFNNSLDEYKNLSITDFEKIRSLELKRGMDHKMNMLTVCDTFLLLSNSIKLKINDLKTHAENLDIENELVIWTASNRTGQQAPGHLPFNDSYSSDYYAPNDKTKDSMR